MALVTRLNTPLTFSSSTLSNRLGLAPLNTGLFKKGAPASATCLEFYRQFSLSGLGLIYIGGVAVSDAGRANRRALSLDSPLSGIGLTQVVAEAHANGTRVVVQIEHAGRQANPREIGHELVAPSPIPCPVIGVTPRELKIEEIRELTVQFAVAAEHAANCGADYIEVHAAHGYLVSSFLSPYSNHRTDQYGGSIENRFRFLREILEEIRDKVRLPLGIRINCRENCDGGLHLSDAVSGVCSLLGHLSYVSISGGVYSTSDDLIIPSRQMPRPIWGAESSVFKRSLDIPVFLCGNIDTVALAESIITEELADVALMGRALLTDPQLFRKCLDGQSEFVQECTDCGMCKWHSRGLNRIYCPFNRALNSSQVTKRHET